MPWAASTANHPRYHLFDRFLMASFGPRDVEIPSSCSQRHDPDPAEPGGIDQSAVGRTSIPKVSPASSMSERVGETSIGEGGEHVGNLWAHLVRAHVELPHREPGRAPPRKAEHRSVDDPLVQRLARDSEELRHRRGRPPIADGGAPDERCDRRVGALRPEPTGFLDVELGDEVAQPALADLPFHQAARTSATLGDARLVAGVDVKIVSELVGHTSPLITWQTHQHVIKGMQTDAAKKVAALIFGGTRA